MHIIFTNFTNVSDLQNFTVIVYILECNIQVFLIACKDVIYWIFYALIFDWLDIHPFDYWNHPWIGRTIAHHLRLRWSFFCQAAGQWWSHSMWTKTQCACSVAVSIITTNSAVAFSLVFPCFRWCELPVCLPVSFWKGSCGAGQLLLKLGLHV